MRESYRSDRRRHVYRVIYDLLPACKGSSIDEKIPEKLRAEKHKSPQDQQVEEREYISLKHTKIDLTEAAPLRCSGGGLGNAGAAKGDATLELVEQELMLGAQLDPTTRAVVAGVLSRANFGTPIFEQAQRILQMSKTDNRAILAATV